MAEDAILRTSVNTFAFSAIRRTWPRAAIKTRLVADLAFQTFIDEVIVVLAYASSLGFIIELGCHIMTEWLTDISFRNRHPAKVGYAR